VFPSELAESLYAPYRLSKDKPITEEGAFSPAYQPAERAGSDEDMAGAMLFLASRAGAFTNGSVMLLDGGKLATMPCTY
jgi:NAD(P)-dependent dehydrogenase (short-subunit alcohol dehydrogenase family)